MPAASTLSSSIARARSAARIASYQNASVIEPHNVHGEQPTAKSPSLSQFHASIRALSFATPSRASLAVREVAANVRSIATASSASTGSPPRQADGRAAKRDATSG